MFEAFTEPKFCVVNVKLILPPMLGVVLLTITETPISVDVVLAWIVEVLRKLLLVRFTSPPPATTPLIVKLEPIAKAALGVKFRINGTALAPIAMFCV